MSKNNNWLDGDLPSPFSVVVIIALVTVVSMLGIGYFYPDTNSTNEQYKACTETCEPYRVMHCHSDVVICAGDKPKAILIESK